MFRFACLYAIGQMLNRTPVFLDSEAVLMGLEGEIAEMFPEFHRRIYYIVSKYILEIRISINFIAEFESEIQKYSLYEHCVL